MAETISGGQVKPPEPPAPPPAPPPTPQPRISKRDRDLLAMVEQGVPYSDIAKHFKIAAQQVSRIAIRNGVRRRMERGSEPEPRPFVGSPGAKAAGEKAAATRMSKAKDAQIVTLFAVAFESLYSIIGQFEGKHWQLEEDESDDLAKALKDALDTLEGEEYERAITFLSRVSPWASLGAALWVVTKPRIEQSTRERATREAAERDRRERATTFGVIRGGQNPGVDEQTSDPSASVGGSEPNGQTTWPDAV